jgi:hypothetical protein
VPRSLGNRLEGEWIGANPQAHAWRQGYQLPPATLKLRCVSDHYHNQ